MTTKNKIAVLDAGGQYIDLVRKAVERQGVQADVLPLRTTISAIEGKYGAIIISGSPASSSKESAPQPDKAIWLSELPLLGICYGMQSMVVSQGGEVTKNAIREDGRITTTVDNNHPIFKSVKKELTALFTHGDFVKTIPLGYSIIGKHSLSDGSTAVSAIAKGNKIGVQFHPESILSEHGHALLKNFLTVDVPNRNPNL
jgi:GMP synthase (glutamine-hydrolysing)